ncbi:MAG: beta-ketoacyl-ACP synthase III [Bdellovibrionales bacterium]
MYKTRISGTGSYLPEKRLTNKDLEKMMDTSDEWIFERTGIRARAVAASNQGTSDLAFEASKRALEMANLKATDIDMIIFGTVTPDQVMPSAACFLQKKLGCRNVMAFDLNAACTGFLYGLAIADQFIRTGTYKNILVVGAEVLTRKLNYEDRETCILFGDAAGAVIASRAPEGENSEILSQHLYAEGNLADLLEWPAGGTSIPITHEVLDQGLHWMKMKGRDIFKNAVRSMGHACGEALRSSGLKTEQIDWVIAHQANLRIIEAVAKNANMPMDKFILFIEEMGNTSAATIPCTLDYAVRKNQVQRGQHLLLTAFGAGLTSGSILLRY